MRLHRSQPSKKRLDTSSGDESRVLALHGHSGEGSRSRPRSCTYEVSAGGKSAPACIADEVHERDSNQTRETQRTAVRATFQIVGYTNNRGRKAAITSIFIRIGVPAGTERLLSRIQGTRPIKSGIGKLKNDHRHAPRHMQHLRPVAASKLAEEFSPTSAALARPSYSLAARCPDLGKKFFTAISSFDQLTGFLPSTRRRASPCPMPHSIRAV